MSVIARIKMHFEKFSKRNDLRGSSILLPAKQLENL